MWCDGGPCWELLEDALALAHVLVLNLGGIDPVAGSVDQGGHTGSRTTRWCRTKSRKWWTLLCSPSPVHLALCLLEGDRIADEKILFLKFLHEIPVGTVGPSRRDLHQ